VSQHLTLRLAAHEPLPDIVMLNYLGVPELAAADVLADLSGIIDPVRQDLYDGARTVISYGGKTIAVPYTLKSKLFYYREDLFQQAGIDPAALRSITDFIDAGRRFHDKFPDRHMIGVGPTLDNGQTGEIMSAFPQGRYASRSGNFEVTSNPCFAQTLQFQKQLFDSGIGLPIASFSADWPPAIKNGRLGAFMTAQWMKTYLPEYAGAAQAGRWKAILWPTLDPLPDQRYGSDQGGAVWIVPKGAPNRALAMEYLRSGLLDRDGSVDFFRATAQPPLLRSAQGNTLDYLKNKRKPAHTSRTEWLQQPENFFGLEYFPIEFDSYNYARTFEFDPNAAIENDMLNTAASEAYTGGRSIPDALKSAETAMKNQIGNPYLA
jgi:ABC-type glycerol-3-phosphate transport system substrate-binding protein